MKKTLLGLGTLACVAIPVTATIACSFDEDENKKSTSKNINNPNGNSNGRDVDKGNNNNPNGNSNGRDGDKGNNNNPNGNSNGLPITKDIHILDDSKKMNSLFIKNRTQDPRGKNVKLDANEITLAENIREKMNENKDIQWHTYGDPIVDGINALRLAIHNDINGDHALKNKIRQFANNPFHDQRTANPSSRNIFSEFAKKQINDWFDSDTKISILGNNWGPMEAASKSGNALSMQNAFDKNKETLDSSYGALTLGTPQISSAQHRVQEIDWLGQFDGHDHKGTIDKIKNGLKTYNNHPTGEFAKAPLGDGDQGCENYVFPFTYNDHKINEGGDFISGLLTAIDVLYDSDDGSGSTGHRTNFYSKNLTTIGWSRYADNYGTWANYQYLITESGSEKRPVMKIDEIKKNNPFLNEYSIEMLKNITPLEFIKAINTNKDGNKYLDFIEGKNANKMSTEFLKPHTSFAELESDIKIAQIGPGYTDYISLKEPNSFHEYPRLAKQQVVGKPDVWVKTYDYNGGGTITGHQYGYSKIDETLF